MNKIKNFYREHPIPAWLITIILYFGICATLGMLVSPFLGVGLVAAAIVGTVNLFDTGGIVGVAIVGIVDAKHGT